MIVMMQENETEIHEAMQYLDDQVVGTSEDVHWNMKCILLITIILPNILPTVNLGMLKQLRD
jgi:hypothetical protein